MDHLVLKTTGGTHGGKATATNTVQPHRLSQPIRSLIWCTAMIPLAVLNANAQQVDPLQQLQQQLEQLKQQYADTAKVFEQRIAALEEQLEKQKEASAKLKEGTVSVAELAEEAAKKVLLGQSGKVGPTYQGQLSEEPTYDNLQALSKARQPLNSTGISVRAMA